MADDALAALDVPGCLQAVLDAAGGFALQFLTRYAFYGFGAPVGAHVGENGGRLGNQVTQQHGYAVQGVVFRGQDEGFADAVPVEGGI